MGNYIYSEIPRELTSDENQILKFAKSHNITFADSQDMLVVSRFLKSHSRALLDVKLLRSETSMYQRKLNNSLETRVDWASISAAQDKVWKLQTNLDHTQSLLRDALVDRSKMDALTIDLASVTAENTELSSLRSTVADLRQDQLVWEEGCSDTRAKLQQVRIRALRSHLSCFESQEQKVQ
jgi:hypothetical protein